MILFLIFGKSKKLPYLCPVIYFYFSFRTEAFGAIFFHPLMNEFHVSTNSLRAWLLAARPKTLPASIAPVLIGTGLLIADPQVHLKVLPTLVCFLFALWMQIASNLINDLYDFLKGSDGKDRLGPRRATAEGWITPRAMRWGIGIVLLCACLTGCLALYYAGWPLIVVGIACVAGAYAYTSGPYPLAYKGWGDVLVFLFFGVVPVCTTYWIQAGRLTQEVVLASVLCGAVVDTLLVLNNFRDRVEDSLSGKRTLIVRYGVSFGRYFYLILGLSACWFCLVFAVEGYVFAAVLPQVYLFFHISSWRRMVRIGSGRELNRILAETGRNIFLYALLLATGFALNALG